MSLRTSWEETAGTRFPAVFFCREAVWVRLIQCGLLSASLILTELCGHAETNACCIVLYFMHVSCACRFLQGRDSDLRVVAKLKHAVLNGDDVHVIIRNYAKDGTPFWNELFMAPLRDAGGRVVHFVGIQSDVLEERAHELAATQNAQLIAEGFPAEPVFRQFPHEEAAHHATHS